MMMMMSLMIMIIMCSVVRATLYYINIAIVGWGEGRESELLRLQNLHVIRVRVCLNDL